MKRIIAILTCACACVALHAATTQVSPGSGTLKSAISNADAGDILVLTDGTYTETTALKPSVPMTICAAEGSSPELKLSSRIEVIADFSLQGITVTSSGEVIRMLAAETPYDVTVTGCTMSGCPNYFIRAYSTSAETPYIRSLTVTNCLFHMPKDGDTGSPRAIAASKMLIQLASLTVANCTFDGALNGAGRFIYLHPGDGIEEPRTPEGTVTIDHCTFYNSTDTRGVYLANINGAHVSNCIFMNPVQRDNTVSYAMYGSNSLIENSLACNAPIKYSTGAVVSHCINRNPYFVDAANGNFRLYANSPAVNAGTDGSTLGDPRWGVSDEMYDNSHDPYEQ